MTKEHTLWLGQFLLTVLTGNLVKITNEWVQLIDTNSPLSSEFNRAVAYLIRDIRSQIVLTLQISADLDNPIAQPEYMNTLMYYLGENPSYKYKHTPALTSEAEPLLQGTKLTLNEAEIYKQQGLIACIKAYRARTGEGLRDAKQEFDHACNLHNLTTLAFSS